MKQSHLIFLLLLVLAACGTSEPVVIDDEIDLATLPETIDAETAAAIKDRDDVILIDVREQWEYDEAHIPGITLIPMSELKDRISEVPTDKTIVLSCQSGARSGRVQAFLQQLGYDDVHNLRGGIVAWEKAGFDVE